MVMIVQGNDILYNDLPNSNIKKEFETYNDKTLKEMKVFCQPNKSNSELLSMKTKLSLLLSKHKRNYDERNPKIAKK